MTVGAAAPRPAGRDGRGAQDDPPAATRQPGDEGYQPIPAPRWWQLQGRERAEAVARLRAWVDTVFRPGYGHLAEQVGPCWEQHDLCLYQLAWLSEMHTAIFLAPERAAGQRGRLAHPAAARRRGADGRGDRPLRPPAPRAAGDRTRRRPVGEGVMTAAERSPQETALAYAAIGWPVFPCRPGSKEPATRNGFHDATTDHAQIREWWRREPDRNVAIATGAPGPDVVDVDVREDGSGFAALNQAMPGRADRRAPRDRPHPVDRDAPVLPGHRSARRDRSAAGTSTSARRAAMSSPRRAGRAAPGTSW